MRDQKQSTSDEDILLFGPNPTEAKAELQNVAGAKIVKDGESYDSIGLTYDEPPEGLETVVTLVPIDPVTKIVTTKIDGTSVELPWSSDGDGWHYTPPADLESGTHDIHFTVTWGDGSKHDPKIIINPTN